jgi:opacity protein-like surface antigen
MKRIYIAALVLAGLIASANAQQVNVINFTNACNYKLALKSVAIDALKADPSESGDWSARGSILYTIPNTPSNMPTGVEIKNIHLNFYVPVTIAVTAAEVAAKSGSNELVKVNKVLRDKVRALGTNLKAGLAQ